MGALTVRILMCLGILYLFSNNVTGTSYADGTKYGCSHKFFKPHCWKYCTGNSGKWCYTVWGVIMGQQSCRDEHDCESFSTCQGWCAWNSQKGCSTACREEVVSQAIPEQNCRRPWWHCQSQAHYSYNNGWRSLISTQGVWISPDIESNTTSSNARISKNKVETTKVDHGTPQSFLWFPNGEIRLLLNEFYWMFNILDATDSVLVGLSDIEKIKPGLSSTGLYYGGNLSDGSKMLISSFGPPLKTGDKVGLIAKQIEEVKGSKLKVYFMLNDQPLGLAFDVPLNTLTGLYPVVTLYGTGSVVVEEIDSKDIPSKIEPDRVIDLEGNWTLVHPGNISNTPTRVTMKLFQISDRSDDLVYRIRLFIFSKFMGELRKPIGEQAFKATLFDVPNNTGRTSEEIIFESNLLKHINGVNYMELDIQTSKLILKSTDTTTSQTVWNQIESKPRTVLTNPFKKLT